VVAAPDEQPGQIQAVVGVQVRQQHMHRSRVDVPLQGAQHPAAEVDNQRWRVRRLQQVSRCRRVRTHHTPGAAEHGQSHVPYCAMFAAAMTKTPALCPRFVTEITG